MSRIDFPRIYNPGSQTSQELIDNFVVRTNLFRDIFNDIRQSKMTSPEQHYIIQGLRGQGKTTLLLRIAYEIERNKPLRKRLIPVIFNEEQYHINRLYKLWEAVAEHLQENDEFPGISDQMQKLIDEEDDEPRCYQLLENALKRHKKKMILFIDNIDAMFDKFSKKEHHRLREVLLESAELRIIGASSVSLEFHYDYGKPFFQFFRMPQLKGLTLEETKTLLLNLGELYKRERVKEIISNQPGRVEALRRITGGVIRTIILLFQIFVDDENGNAFRDLEKILDDATPLYKHRMDSLPPQLQGIVDFIALSWDAVSVKEIVKKTRLESKAVSAQLKQLEKYHIVEKESTDTKNYLYRIHERFFNIWYLMRLGRKKDEKKVRFLVEFLQSWCDEKDLENRAMRHLQAIQHGEVYETHALYMTEALARTPLKSALQHQLIAETRRYLDQAHSELKNKLSKSDQELQKIANDALKRSDYKTFIENIEQIKSKSIIDYAQLGKVYWQEKKDLNTARKYFITAVEKGDSTAMFYLANMYRSEFKDLTKAKKYYLMAIDKDHTNAMFNLALMYELEFKDFAKAEKYYLMAVDKDHANAMLNLALMHELEFKDFAKAEKYYLMAIDKGDSNAMNSLAWMYYEEKINLPEALRYGEQAYTINKNIFNAHTYSMVLLWANQIQKAWEVAEGFLKEKESYDQFPDDVSFFIMLLIAKKQHHLALKLFNENPHDLKDRFKPVYYALMYFMREDYPNEFRKMGSDLKQTVEEIIQRIQKLAKDYE